jgi:hypothetical protein
MTRRFLDITATPKVIEARKALGSFAAYDGPSAGPAADLLTEDEAEFIAARDSFYLASGSETGWPYVQHRGGPPGFLKVIDATTLAFADFRGNRQYLSLGNVTADSRVALILMDYPNRRRLKILGRMVASDLSDDPDLAARLALPNYRARTERAFVIQVEAFDWNCPQHITPRFTMAEIESATTPLRQRLTALEAENQILRDRLAGASPES